jgi:hypothetical protein
MLSRLAWSLVLFLAIPFPLAAQVKLAWTFKQGERFFVEEVVNVRQTIKIAGTENRQDLDQTKVSRFLVLKANPDGSAVLEQKIEAVKVKVSGEGPDADTKVLGQFVGATFLIGIDAKRAITRFDGYEQLIKKIVKDNPVNVKLVRALMTEESLKAGIQDMLAVAPTREVMSDKTWTSKTTLPLGPLGTLTLVNTYKLAALAEASKEAKITMTAKASYTAPDPNPNLSLKVTGGDIRLERIAGTYFFDTIRGRLLRSESSHTLEGTLKVTIRDAPVEMDLHQDQTLKRRVLEKNPVEK